MEESNYYHEIREIENNAIEHIVLLFTDNNIKQIKLEKEVNLVHTRFDITITPISIFRVDNHELYAIDANGNKIHSSYIVSSFFAEMFPIIKETIIKRNDKIIEQGKKLNENKKTKKMCFLPIKHISSNLGDIDFYEKALEYGKVFTMEEYANYFNSRNIMDIQPSLGEMRVVETLEYIMGICPVCGSVIALDSRNKTIHCPICGENLKNNC
jgi:rubrerythrin